MKRLIIGTLAVSMLCSGCATSGYGGANAVFAGAAIGNNVGSAIGGIIGDKPRVCGSKRTFGE